MLTTSDVAGRLNVSSRTVQRLIQSEGLPAFRIGGHYRYVEQELDRWLVRKRMRTTWNKDKVASTRAPRAGHTGSNIEVLTDGKFEDLLKPKTRKKLKPSWEGSFG